MGQAAVSKFGTCTCKDVFRATLRPSICLVARLSPRRSKPGYSRVRFAPPCTTFHLTSIVPSHNSLSNAAAQQGVLVYDTQTLASAALKEEQESSPGGDGGVPPKARVVLGQRPYSMAVSRDNLRVAVAVRDKVRTGWNDVILFHN